MTFGDVQPSVVGLVETLCSPVRFVSFIYVAHARVRRAAIEMARQLLLLFKWEKGVLMIRRFLGGVGITAVLTMLLFLSVLTGTANAAVGTIVVKQLNAIGIPVCAKNHFVNNQTAPQTIHDATCAGAVLVSITSTTVQPITVRTDYATVRMLGLLVTPIGPNGVHIDVPAGL